MATSIVPPMQTLQVERAGGVVTVTMNRPERKNAINAEMAAELTEVFRALATNTDDRCVVLTGAGGEFSSGADLSAGPSGKHGLAAMRDTAALVQSVHDLPQPTIAKVEGVAVGLGANLALGCDLIVASETARFSEIFARRGLAVDGGGSYLLPRLVGMHRAKELVFFAEILSAAEAAGVGLVNRVVAPGELDGFVAEWAGRLATGPSIALSLSKKLLNQSFSVTMAQALEAEAQAQTVNFGTQDTVEAMTAFVQKRDPVFKAR